MGEKLEPAGHKPSRVSLSVGVTTTVDPKVKAKELEKQADEQMFRAKEKTRGPGIRPSALAAAGEAFMMPFDDQVA